MIRFTVLLGLLAALGACNAEDSPTGLVGAVGNEPWLHGDHENPCGISVEPTDSDTKYDYGYARCSEGEYTGSYDFNADGLANGWNTTHAHVYGDSAAVVHFYRSYFGHIGEDLGTIACFREFDQFTPEQIALIDQARIGSATAAGFPLCP